MAQTLVRKNTHTEVWQTWGTYDVLVARIPVGDKLDKGDTFDNVVVVFEDERIEVLS